MSATIPEIRPPSRGGADVHPLVKLLVEQFHAAPESLGELAQAPGAAGLDLHELKRQLLQNRTLTPELVQQALARLLGLEYWPHLDEVQVLPDFATAIPIRYAKKHGFFPVRMTEQELWLAAENPEQPDALLDVGRQFQRRVRLVVATRQAILGLINRAYDREQAAKEQGIDEIPAIEGAGGGLDWGIEEPEDLLDARDEEPIKRLLNNVLYQAAKSNTSDVHVDATPNEVVVRFRVDGVLHTASSLPKSIQRTLINRIKVMSRLDISQHGLPQDGRTLILIAGRKIDIRVSIMPTIHGEKAVMRLLYQDQDLFDLRQLGMPEYIYVRMMKLIQQTGGIVLVSGPTGSGKTTTLYAALSEIDHHSNNIMTIEDPVEYKISGYVQTEVNAKLGLTFANALRSVLRQDPDVIMVGEMRDRETALIAIQAALTGHTVFSTVHTNNAPATITRLVDMGIEPYLVSSTVMAVLAQRLVRRVCTQCRTQVPVDPAVLRELGVTEAEAGQLQTVPQAPGCPACKGTGYHGRQGIFELLLIDEPIKKVLLHTNEANVIREAAIGQGMVSMRRHGIQLIRQGVTTVEEVLQATRED
ncbi:MAG TPA: GspE/PulE family protein [bacterium]|nr:GspE/PulE family protein [bacterium]